MHVVRSTQSEADSWSCWTVPPLDDSSGEVSRDHGGFGIGLALVREIATRHGRDVAVVNTGPTGTTMRMRLPHWGMVSMWCR